MQLERVRKAVSSLRIFPKSHDFFGDYRSSAENVVMGVKLLCRMIADADHRQELLRELKDCELAGDKVTHGVIDLLHHTFLTPFDRADMHTLIVKMDDILDFAYYVGNRLTRYRVQEVPDGMTQLAQVLCRASEEIAAAVVELRDLKHSQQILARCHRVKELEHEADEIMNAAIEDVFSGIWEPIEVIKLKELLENLEGAADKCEDVANIIEGIILRHV